MLTQSTWEAQARTHQEGWCMWAMRVSADCSSSAMCVAFLREQRATTVADRSGPRMRMLLPGCPDAGHRQGGQQLRLACVLLPLIEQCGGLPMPRLSLAAPGHQRGAPPASSQWSDQIGTRHVACCMMQRMAILQGTCLCMNLWSGRHAGAKAALQILQPSAARCMGL